MIRGFAWPWRYGDNEVPEIILNEDAIEASLRMILLTGVGQRRYRHGYGTNVWGFVFETDRGLLTARIRREVADAIRVNEPRCQLRGIQVEYLDDKKVARVTIKYSYRQQIQDFQHDVPLGA